MPTLSSSAARASAPSSSAVASTRAAAATSSSVSSPVAAASSSSAAAPASISQAIPNASAVPSTGSSNSSSSSSFPLPAIIVIAIVGAAVVFFLAYKLYRFIHARCGPNARAPLPAARSLLAPSVPTTPAGTGGSHAGRSLSMLIQDPGNDQTWRQSMMLERGPGVFAGMAAHSRYSTSTTSPDSPFPTTSAFPASSPAGSPGGFDWNGEDHDSSDSAPQSPDFSRGRPDGQRYSSLTLPYSAHPRDSSGHTIRGNGGGSGSSTPPTGGPAARRSVYAMSLYSTPHVSANNPPAQYQARLSTHLPRNHPHRISGAPHSPHSRVEIVPPQPLGPRPGAVVADTKSTLNFTRASGIGGDENDWFRAVSSGVGTSGSWAPDGEGDDPLQTAGAPPHLASAPIQHERKSSVASTFFLSPNSRSGTPGPVEGQEGSSGSSRGGGPFRDPSVGSSLVAKGRPGVMRDVSDLSALGGAFAGGGSERSQSPPFTGTGSDHSPYRTHPASTGDEDDGESDDEEEEELDSHRDGGVPTSPLSALQEDLRREAKRERRRKRKGKDKAVEPLASSPTGSHPATAGVPEGGTPGESGHRRDGSQASNFRPPSLHLDDILQAR